MCENRDKRQDMVNFLKVGLSKNKEEEKIDKISFGGRRKVEK